MRDVILFSGKEGEWEYARQLKTPSSDELAFITSVESVVGQRLDHYVAGMLDTSELLSVLEDVVKTRSDLDKAVSASVRSRSATSAVSSIVSALSEEHSLDKKHVQALKDVLKVFSVRYVLSNKLGDFEHILDVGSPAEPLGDGYFFVANTGDWVVVKKQRISEKTTPLDVIFSLVSISASLRNRAEAVYPLKKKRLKPSQAQEQALEISDGGKDVAVYDHALRFYMAAGGFPIHYGVAYDRIRPPKRIKGLKTK